MFTTKLNEAGKYSLEVDSYQKSLAHNILIATGAFYLTIGTLSILFPKWKGIKISKR